ncbi:MAG: HAD family hydrolase [Actinomycetota bacterium]|nr:HAD family hydrolase [Actinomycetota bacterium]
MDDLSVVFFDYGDTLAYWAVSGAALWREVLNDLEQVDVPLEEIQAARMRVDDELRDQIYAYHGSLERYRDEQGRRTLRHLGFSREHTGWLVPQVIRGLEERRRHAVHLFPEVREVLRTLSERGYRLAMISNALEDLLHALDDLELRVLFQSVTYSQEVGSEKPDPKIFRLALQRMDCLPGQAAHVGNDYGADVVGARSVGIFPVLIDRHDYHPEVDCLRIRDLRELLPHLPGP